MLVLLPLLAAGCTGATARSAAPSLLPSSFAEVSTGTHGGAMWAGVIPDSEVPAARRESAVYLPPTVSGLGAAAGLLYAAGDVATKGAVAGGTAVAFVPAVLAAHGLAFVCLQLGFQRGRVLATAGVATLLTNALPIAAGIALFGERVPADAAGVTRMVAFACVVVGAAALVRADG